MSKKKNKKNSGNKNVQYVNRNNNKNVKKQVAISEQEQRHRAAAANRAKASSRQSEEKTKVFKAVKPEDFVKISQSAPPPKPQKKKKRHYSATAPKAQTVQQKKSGKKRIWIFVILLIAVVAVLSSVEFISAKKGSNANNNQIAEETYKRLRDETAAPQTESKTETQTEAPTVTTETTTTTTNFLDTVDLSAELDPVKQLDVDVVMQKPELPTGCEVTSLTMILNYWGYNISKTDLADNFLPQTEDYYGKIDFNDYFGGSPYNDNDFGCFAPVIQKTAENYFKTVPNPMEAANVSGQSLDDLCHYIDLGYPVVVWATIGCYEADWKHYWTLDNGEEVDFPSLEHCVVLTGYDKNNNLVYINDPLKGAVSYDKDTFENVYDEMRQMAVLVYK